MDQGSLVTSPHDGDCAASHDSQIARWSLLSVKLAECKRSHMYVHFVTVVKLTSNDNIATYRRHLCFIFNVYYK